LMWDWQISPRLSLTNALRVDRLSLDHQGSQFTVPGEDGLYHAAVITEPSFNSGAVFRLSNNQTIRASAARAIQLPSLLDLGFAKTFGPIIVAGDTQLQPSKIINYEIDYDRILPALGATLRVAAFAQHSTSIIGSVFGSGASRLPTGQILLQSRNFGDSDEFGGEIGLKSSSATGFHWNISYALAAVHDESPQALLADAASANYQRQTPVSSVLAGAGTSWRQLDLDLQARWQSHYEDSSPGGTMTLAAQPVVVPNYITVDARLAWRLTQRVTVSLVGNQLLRQRVMETAGLKVERRLLAGFKVKF
ncbi:MAG: TonB-dependent receptor domain-containing protein, partial [Janthinobacterium lividum]